MRTSDVVKDLEVADKGSPDVICEPCIDGKMHRAPHTTLAEPAKEPLSLVFTDLKGPLDTQSRQGYRYWVSFTDSFSRMVAVYFLRTKGDVFGAFKQYRAWAQNQMNKRAVKFDDEDLRRTVKALRDDKGGEYTSKALDEFCGEYGIEREHTIRDTPQQNGVSERFNRTMAEGITAMLAHSKLPPFMWADAGAAFVHIHNRCPSSAIGFKTPYELWNGEKPSVAHLRVWGCLAFVHLQKDQRRQLAPHARRCIFIGYPPDYKGWVFWDPERGTAIVSDSVIFAEEKFPGKIRGKIGTDLLDDVPVPESPSLSPQIPSHPPVPPPPPAPLTLNPTYPDPPEPPSPQLPMSPILPNFDHSRSRSSTPVLLRIPVGSRHPSTRVPRLSREARNLTKWFERHPHNENDQPSAGPSTEPNNEPDEQPDSDGEPEIADFAFGVDIDDMAEFVAYGDTEVESVDTVGSKESTPPANDNSSTSNPKETNSTHQNYVGLNDVVDYAFFSSQELEPNSLAEAAKRPDADKFISAAIDEIKAHLDNGTWEVVQLPPGKKAIGCRWVFKIKRNADGTIERYKGRIVAKGYAQRQGVDYTDTFAPTARFGALRTVIALAAVEDMELESVDISTAFLNGDIDADVYMQVPEGIEIEGEEKGRWVLKLLKALYGIKQGPRLWSKKLNQALEAMGFKRLDCDHSVFIYEKGDIKIIVPVHVDDLVIASKSRSAISNFKKELATHFKIRDQGPTSFLLGVKLERDRPNRTITLSQPAYIQDLLDTYVNAKIFNPVLTPMLDGKLSEKDCPETKEEIEAMKKVPYREAVGKLLYLAIATRPDIAYAVGVLCRFNTNPGPKHWAAVKHLLRYLRGTQNMKLVYSPDSSNERFTTHCDADLGGNPDNSRSTAGYVMKVGSGAVMWGSKLQKHVSLSSTESEYTTASAAAREMMWMRFFLEEIGHDMSAPSTLFMDSGSAIQVAQNPEHQSTMKHVHRSFNWIREKVESKELRVAHVPGDENVADIFTKPLQKNKFLLFRDMLGLRR
jgi:transposase InsO family protein/predicted RNA binding protein YcfA (HicA-like mRNA interferase family)